MPIFPGFHTSPNFLVPRLNVASEGGSLSEPTGSSAIEAAVTGLETTMLGSVATTIAVIAVASVGFMMLTGRTDWRRGATVIAGCFIIFGARDIAAALQAVTFAGNREIVYPPVATTATFSPRPRPSPQVPPADPYAGATVLQN